MADLLQLMTGLATMKTRPTDEMLEAVEAIVFSPMKLNTRLQAQSVRDQAILAIGGMVCLCFFL